MPSPEEVNLLIVDDDEANCELLFERLSSEGYPTEVCSDGEEAWDLLEATPNRFDVILLDRRMPKLSGLELLKRIKDHPRMGMVPVIMQTGMIEAERIREGIEAGAYYYLTKPYDTSMLLSIVKTAANDYEQFKVLHEVVEKGQSGMALLREARFVFRTIKEAVDLGTVLANACPDPGKIVVGLTELLINAVEHGNLGISYEEKTELNAAGRWIKEVERRLELPTFANRIVEVNFKRNQNAIRIRIKDEGRGFEWTPFLQIDPNRAFHTHGRGIAMANLFSFDALEYHGLGNDVTGTIQLSGSSIASN